MENRENNGVILSFQQDASFYHRHGARYAESNDLIKAVSYLRKAYAMEPDNLEYVLSLAEVLHRLHRYEESIQVLLLYAPFSELPAEALYGLAVNFMGMEEFPVACQCADLCSKKDAEGMRGRQAMDLLALIADREELAYQIGLSEHEDVELLERIHLAKSLQFSGQEQAILPCLCEISEKYPESDVLDMEIAMAMFLEQRYDEAKQRLFHLFQRNSKHVRAHALMAFLLYSEGRFTEAEEECAQVLIDSMCSPEELAFAGTVFSEMGLYPRAKEALLLLQESLPYDVEMLHQLARCFAEEGDFEEASNCYAQLLRLNEHDTVAAYYYRVLREEGGQRYLDTWTLLYDVPLSEALVRQRRITEVLQGGEEALRSVVKNDEHYSELLEWALFSSLCTMRRSVVAALKTLGDAYSERILRRFLITMHMMDDEKQLVLQALLAMRSQPPFSMYINGMWQYGIAQPLVLPDQLPRSFADILEAIRETSPNSGILPLETLHLPERTSEMATRIFVVYVVALRGKFPRLTAEQTDAMAAAFVLMALSALGMDPIPHEEILNWYEVSQRRVDNALKRIFERLQSDSEGK